MDTSAFGRYDLQSLIGEGGMGRVYRAYDTETDRVVAVKVLHERLATDPEYRERFRREAHSTARLREPHIVPIHHFGEIDGRLYLDMRLIDGTDLHTLLSQRGAMPPRLAVSFIDQAAAALDAAHAEGLVHRDVKPSNLLINGRDFVYLIDFGIAHSGAVGLTGVGNAIGTFTYMAPERFTTGHADARSDVYALACVLYECLTGNRPYPGDSLEQQLAGHLHTPPPRPSPARPGIPVALDEVIARGLAKNPDHRYPTAGALAAAARRAVESAPRTASPFESGSGARQPATRILPPPPRLGPPAPPPRPVAAPVPSPRRRRRAVGVISSVAILAALIGAITYFLLPPAAEEEPDYRTGYSVETTGYPSEAGSPVPSE
ncbi:serine/threonine-protein kinase [Nocardia sp. NPDC005746]|uniref:serine/threonine-protein kinase n=1 Tax=Nocardia sp. NPDC005746 TaxID=3157062 RepID=UPI0033E806DA